MKPSSNFGRNVDNLFETGEAVSFASLVEATKMDECAASATSERILSTLEQANKDKTIDTNPVTRLRRNIEKFNANLGKLSIQVDGKDLTPLAETVKVKVPQFAQHAKTLEAVGKHRKATRLEVFVTYP